MNTDVKTLLERAANDGHPIDPIADYAADLRRARRHVHVRRSARLSAAGAALLVAGLVIPTALSSHGRDGVPAPPTASNSKTHSGTALKAPELVAYHGRQGQAFHLAWVPAGWEIVASDNVEIVLAPTKGADPNPQMMDDKIEVGALSDGVDLDDIRDVPAHPTKKQKTDGTSRFPINGREGYYSVPSFLTFKAKTGRWIHIQLPNSLNWEWSPAQLRKFAEGITVGKNLGHAGG